MDFNFQQHSLKAFTLMALISMIACGPKNPLGDDGQNLIGTPLEKVSTLTKLDGQDSDKVFVFDETTRKIHQFQLNSMSYQKSYSVRQPDRKHVVLSQDQGNYMIDLCEKVVTIYSKNGLVQEDPISFQGQPLSAAFRSDLNLLVMYDDLNSVGLVKMDNQGQVLDSWMGGNLINGKSIKAGDLLSNGKLVLSLSDNSFAVVDIDQTLALNHWVFTTFASGLTSNISWIAPIASNPNRIFIKAGSELAIFDVVTLTKITSTTLTDPNLIKLSKSSSGHVITGNLNGTLTLFYENLGVIEQRSLENQKSLVLVSTLNHATDSWKFIDSNSNNIYFSYNDADFSKVGRTLKAYRLSDMLALKKTKIPDQSQVLISDSFVFNLFPSELGYATSTNINSGQVLEAKFFNVGHINN